jgi:predicted transglutaminase-like cysteine proteinase
MPKLASRLPIRLSFLHPPRPFACARLAACALRRAARALLMSLLCASLVVVNRPLWAWDGERMLQAAQKISPRAVEGVRALQPMLALAREQDERGRLQSVNQFWNRRIAFKDDLEVWGQVDYWASPLELLDKGAGDCEDYAIAKYFSLLVIGVPIARLRLVYVRAQLGGPGGPTQAHMVLAWYAEPNAEPLILDNLIGELRPASRRPDLEPVFSFNGEGLWQGTGGTSAGDPSARLARWPAVLAKARAEGFL